MSKSVMSANHVIFMPYSIKYLSMKSALNLSQQNLKNLDTLAVQICAPNII